MALPEVFGFSLLQPMRIEASQIAWRQGKAALGREGALLDMRGASGHILL
jgi:hypothetical protein